MSVDVGSTPAVLQFALQLVEGDQTVHYIWSPRKQLRDNTRPSETGADGADGSSREQRGAEGGWWRGRVLVEGGSGHDWHQAVACGPASLARHHPVLTSGTWGHPHYHCFRVSTIHGDFRKIWRSRVAFSLLKVPSSSFTQ